MDRTIRSRRTTRAVIAALVIGGAALTAGCATASVPADPVAIPEPMPQAAGDLTASDVDAWLDGLLPAALDDADIAGATVSVVHDGSVLTTRGYGAADLGTGDGDRRPVDPDATLFRMGSVSKLFSATAVMQLVERGDVDLDADVNDYLDFELAEPRGTITLRTLLTHTAGFEERAAGVIEPPGVDSDLREYLTEDQPDVVYAAGAVPAYSNYGNSLAGYVVERVSGMPFADYVQENILDRVGMPSSTFTQPLPDRLQGDMAAGYADTSQPAVPFEIVGAAPAGALSATASDMGRFMLAQLGELPPDQSLLEPETLELMHQPALTENTLGTLADGPRMTLGFFDEDRNGHRVLGHLGDTNVFHSALEILPDDAAGIFISMNSTGAAGEAGTLREAVMTGFTDRYFPTEETAGANRMPRGDATADHAALAAGTYEPSRALRSTFLSTVGLTGQTQVAAREDGTVLITPGPESTKPAVYRETAPWVWTEVGGQQRIAMRVENGSVTAIGFDSAFALLRVDAGRDAALVVPLTITAIVVLLIGALAPVVGWAARRYLRAPAREASGGRIARILTWSGSVATLVAAVAWLQLVQGALAFADTPDLIVRVVQALQVLGALALVPAVLSVVSAVLPSAGWTRTAGRTLIVAALAWVTWFALSFHLIAPSISY